MNTENLLDKYKFTGKERDVETGYDYFGARQYDTDIERWLQVDPMADKYSGWIPYNYCLNNPVNVIDPNGDTVKIQDGDSFIIYTAGMEFHGSNQFVAKVIHALNMMNSKDMVIEVLSSTVALTNNYSFLNMQSNSGQNLIGFKPTTDKNNVTNGADIYAASMNKEDDYNNLKNVSHELFHAYQIDKNVYSNRSSNLEVEAI